MADVKIQFKAGAVEFSCEGSAGDKQWLAEQLDKILVNAPSLISAVPEPQENENGGNGQGHRDGAPMQADPDIAKKPLAAFLREKNATTNQVRKFLAAAAWLEAKGKKRLSTGDVTKALREANQARIGNPSDSLAKNINKGFCERDGDEFFVTEEGKGSL
jgi:hypothetical protein